MFFRLLPLTYLLNPSQDFLVDPFTYNYMNSSFQSNRDPPHSYEGRYSTDVVADKAFRLLDEAVKGLESSPFFLTIAPIAPHGNIYMNGSILDENHVFEHGPPVAAERHKHLFKDVKVPRTVNFNPDKVTSPSALRSRISPD
jgi:hypothetical protein